MDKTTPLAVIERRRKVAALVKAGLTERQIAQRLDVSRTTVWTDKQVLAAAAAQ